MSAEPLTHFRYRKTACFAARMGSSGRWLALDAGWPETLFEYARAAKAVGVRLDDIAAVLVTHMHPDHGGLISAFQSRGVPCLVFDGQREAVDAMERIIRREHAAYRAIDPSALVPLTTSASRAWLAAHGISGEVIATPGHSADSVSFVSDSGEVVIGDLPVPSLVMPEDTVSLESWARIRACGGRHILPAHSAPFTLDADERTSRE